MQGIKADKFASMFAVKDPFLLQESRTEQICQGLRASTAVESFPASDGRVTECYFTLFGQEAVFQTLLNESTLLRSVLTKKKLLPKRIFPQYVPTAMKVSFLFHSTAFVSSCMQKRRLHAIRH